jgi:hypothetical protein
MGGLSRHGYLMLVDAWSFMHGCLFMFQTLLGRTRLLPTLPALRMISTSPMSTPGSILSISRRLSMHVTMDSCGHEKQ